MIESRPIGARALLSDLPRPLHVLFVTGEYPPARGGVGDYTACLSEALAGLGAPCSVITGRQARSPDQRRPLAPAVYGVMDGWGFSHLGSLLRVIDDISPDVVHVQYQTGAFGMQPGINLLLAMLRRRRRRPTLAVTFHDLKVPYLFPKAGPLRSLANAALRWAADLVFVTNGDDLAALGGQADVLPIGSNIEPAPLASEARAAVRTRLGLQPSDLAVGYFGFIDEWKGVDILAAACQRLWDRGASTHRLVFVGGVRVGGEAAIAPHERAVRASLADAERRGLVLRIGFCPPEETSAYLAALDLCVLPFRQGACYRHGSLMAAIAHGLPIVTTNPGANERMLARHAIAPLVDGENALLVPPGDVERLAEAIDRLGRDTALRARIADGAAGLAPQFGWDRIARTSLDHYERAEQSRRAGPARALARPR
jgi:glycosyltransferase involved in cell wall biosynthesis